MSPPRNSNRGAALVTVLWLTAALAVIGFAVAGTVRTEAGRAENLVDGARAGFLARGAIERLRHFLRYPFSPPPGQPPPPFVSGQSRAYWTLPGGDVIIEMLPETGKLSVNQASPELLGLALAATGMPAGRIAPFVNAIVDWRTQLPPGILGASTFWVRHASFEQIEELMLMPGVTTDLFFGYRDRLPGGEVVVRPGLRDVLSVYGSPNSIDLNAAHPALMAAVGIDPETVAGIVKARRLEPLTSPVVRQMFPTALPSGIQPRAGFDGAFTVRATARPRRPDGQLSEYRRTVAALMVYETALLSQPPRLSIRQWYDVATSDALWPGETP